MKYLIWSHEHRAWWAPGHMGYTLEISKAGRYGYETAMRICFDANEYLPEGAEPNEVALLAPESARPSE